MELPSPSALERAGLRCWPGIDVEWDGSWVRRASNGYTKRANSVQCFDPEDDDNIEARIEASRAWFVARGLRPTFRVNLLSGSRLVEALDVGGWIGIDRSYQMAGVLEPADAAPRAEILSLRDPAFFEAQSAIKRLDEATLSGLRGVLAVMDVPAAGIVLRDDAGVPVSSALMAIADGIVVTGNVGTDPARRRQGYAFAMMQAGHAWAMSQGARFAALNVQADNPAAIALYERIGYRCLYDYHYRVPAP